MKRLSVLLGIGLAAVCGASIAAPNHLAPPAFFDNVETGLPWGQTFVSEEPLVLGVR